MNFHTCAVTKLKPASAGFFVPALTMAVAMLTRIETALEPVPSAS